VYFNDVDDIDVLFARLEREDPPSGMTAGVLAAVAERARRRRRIGIAVFILALTVATLLAFLVGHELRASGVLDLITIELQSADLVQAAPLDLAKGLAENVPWVPTGLVVVSLAAAARALPVLAAPAVRFGSRRMGR